jgi:choline dehydrogenase-like flavoprotein
MLLDARRHEDADLETDFCVVGAGPAGLAVTLQLARAGRRVLLVDSGGWRSEKDADTLSSGEVVAGSAHPPLHLYRPRRIGGGTTVWGGRCVLYDPIDFQPRSWMPLSGWPLSFDELRPFYAQATRFCDAGEFAYSAAAALGSRAADFLPALQGTDLETDLLDRFSRPSNLGRL